MQTFFDKEGLAHGATLLVGIKEKLAELYKEGEKLSLWSISKGKGFAGGVKRYHFAGGPRTHGQSDRERAPGSSGSTTTPGRVLKGQRMAGRMGQENVTIKNLRVVKVKENILFLKGLIPGGKNSLIMIRKVGENKKFIPLFKDESEENTKEVKSEDVKPQDLQTEDKSSAVEVKEDEKNA